MKTEENHTLQAIKARKTLISEEIKVFGGDKRDRTADLLNAIQALSQLSYTPKFSCAVRQLLYYSTWAEFVKGYFRFFWNLEQKQT